MGPRIFFFATLLTLSGQLNSQFALNPAEEPKHLDLKEAISLAISSNVEMRVANLLILEQEAQQARSLAMYLPKLELGASQKLNVPSTSISIGEISDDPIVLQPAWQFDMQLTLIQPILNMKAISLMNTSNLEMRRRESNLQATQDELKMRVSKAYIEAIKSDNSVNIAKSWHSRAKSLLNWTQSRQKENLVPMSETQKAQIEVERAINNVEITKTAAELALGALGVLIGMSNGFSVEKNTTFPAIEKVDTLDALIAKSYHQRSDLSAEIASMRVAQSNFDATYSQFYPSIDLVAQGAFSTNPSGLSPAPIRGVFTLQGTWSLYDGGDRYGEIRAKRTQVQIHERKIQDIKAKIEAEVRGRALQIARKIDSLESLKKMQTLQNSVYNQMLSSYQSGLSTLLEVINASHDLRNFQLEIEQAAYDLALARLELAHATGQLHEML